MGSLGRLSPGGSIALGIIVGVLSTSVQSLGLTLQRKSHILEDEKDPHVARRPPHRRRRWQLGMAMFIAANLLGSSIQISTLPLPVLSTLQASGLVFNSLCATLILGEPFTRWSLWGTLLVCSGALLIAVFGAIPSPAHNLDELLALLGRPPFVAWMALQAVLVLAIAIAVEVASFLLATLSQTPSLRLARGLAYGCISGILSAHSLLVAKSAVELVVRTVADGNNQFRRWPAWALVLALVVLALTQLYYLHRGLKLVSTSVLYPLVFCIYNIVAILDGLIYFRQTDLIGPLRACLISLGTVVLLSGVLALSWRLSDEQHPPAVGQSTLTPGLGLVEDTEGEDEEEPLLLGSDVTLAAEDDDDDEERQVGFDNGQDPERQRLLKRNVNYDTFNRGDASVDDPVHSPHPPRRRYSNSMSVSVATIASTSLVTSPTATTTTTPWAERAAIWDELEDQNSSNNERLSSPVSTRRPRSSTLPRLSSDAQSPIGESSQSHNPDEDDDETEATLAAYRRSFRRRRKTTGFPGFHARRAQRTASTGGSFQNTVGHLWNGLFGTSEGGGGSGSGGGGSDNTKGKQLPGSHPGSHPHRDDDPV